MWRKAVPNALSLANLCMGVLAIYLSFGGFLAYAAAAVLLGMLFDACDGAAARLLGTGGVFGKEMDALCDLISFGVAPVFILCNLVGLEHQTWQMMMQLLIFPMCGALRLARFNTTDHLPSGNFVGLPITAAGGILAMTAVCATSLHSLHLSIATLYLSLMMISRVPYASAKSISSVRELVKESLLAMLIIILVLLFMGEGLTSINALLPGEWLLLPLWGYALSGVVHRLLLWRRKEF